MNRSGPPPQRPPNFAPGPGLGVLSRHNNLYPYGLPRSSVSFVPGPQRTSHSQAMPQQAPGFMSRPQAGVGYSSTTAMAGQHQPSSAGLQPQQQPQPQSQQLPPSQTSQQQSTNGTANALSSASASTSLPSHLTSSTMGTHSAASFMNDVGPDLNDFPALGSAPPASSSNLNNSTSHNNSNSTGGSSGNIASYATQAGNGLLFGGNGPNTGGATAGAANSSLQAREFSPDDFPALGNHSQPQTQDHHSHPPGLNGYQHGSEHRQNLLGSLASTTNSATSTNSTPGMLHLGGQQRAMHLGFGQGLVEAEKVQQRQNNYAIKLNQVTHAAWNSTPATSTTHSNNAVVSNQSQALSVTNHFGDAPSSATTATQNGTLPSNPSQTSQALSAPPGVPPPPPSGPTSYGQQQQQPQPGAQPPTQILGHSHPPGTIAYPSNGDVAIATGVAPRAPSPSLHHHHQPPSLHATHPQTPAQQILMSAADRWGLLGLLAMIKGVGREVDGGLSSVGTDLGTMGLDMSFQGNLYPTFITPWADQSAAHTVEPDFHLPACYNVQPPPPGPNKAAAFSDETLFFMFYSHPRDALQEVAAQELWNRNWRYHKELRLWITKETGATPSQKVPGGEQGTYTVWDTENWAKERREMAVLYADLEEKNQPAFVQGPGLVLTAAAAAAAAAAATATVAQTGAQTTTTTATTPSVQSSSAVQSQVQQRAAVAAAFPMTGMVAGL